LSSWLAEKHEMANSKHSYTASKMTLSMSKSFLFRMHVMDHNWSASQQHLHLQSVAEISCHSALSGDSIRHIVWVSPQGHTSIRVFKWPFLSAGTAVSLFRAKTVQQRPLLQREVETRLPDCGVAH